MTADPIRAVPWCCRFGLHKWGVWREPEKMRWHDEDGATTLFSIQRRTCLDCGKEGLRDV